MTSIPLGTLVEERDDSEEKQINLWRANITKRQVGGRTKFEKILEQRLAEHEKNKYKIKGEIKLPPLTQKLLLYESISKESEQLDKKKEVLLETLNSLSQRRTDLEKRWAQFQEYMEEKQKEIDQSKVRQYMAKKKAHEERKHIKNLDEELKGLQKNYSQLLEKRGKIQGELQSYKVYQNFFEQILKEPSNIKQDEFSLGNKTCGQVIIDRYRTLVHEKFEAHKRHQQQTQEIQDIKTYMKIKVRKHEQYVTLCNSKVAILQRKLDKLLSNQNKSEDDKFRKHDKLLDQRKKHFLALQGLDNIYTHCINNGAISSFTGSQIDSKLRTIKEHILFLDQVVKISQNL